MRKRKPLVINDEIVELEAPGLENRDRYGKREWWWIASKAARAAGYRPKAVQLHYTVTSREVAAQLAARCRVLTNEMLDWLSDPTEQRKVVYDGTVNSLVNCYQADQASPYHLLELTTRAGYDDWCRTIKRAFGARRVDALTGQDLRECFAAILEPSSKGGPPRVRLAKACIPTMMPILLNYGSEAKLPGCLELAMIMDRMTFRVPKPIRQRWKAMRPKKVPMTFEHAQAIVREGLRRQTRLYRSIALGVAAQFEMTLSQIDVIGYFEPLERAVVEKGAIVRDGKVWRPGLCYEQFAGGILDMERSKNDQPGVFDVAEYPLFQETLAAVPAPERYGPVVIDQDGRPLYKRRYSGLYRELADAAGVPTEVKNMFARHGGLTEGYNAITARDDDDDRPPEMSDLKYHGQHADLRTTLGAYVKPGAGPSRRVARARVATRPKPKSA